MFLNNKVEERIFFAKRTANLIIEGFSRLTNLKKAVSVTSLTWYTMLFGVKVSMRSIYVVELFFIEKLFFFFLLKLSWHIVLKGTALIKHYLYSKFINSIYNTTQTVFWNITYLFIRLLPLIWPNSSRREQVGGGSERHPSTFLNLGFWRLYL